MKTKILHSQRAFLPVLFTLLLCLVGLTNVMAQTFTVGNLNYSLNNDGVSVTVTGHVDGTAATGELVIPESVTQWGNSYAVTAIGNEAFKNYTQITSVVIGNTVTYIGIGAFVYCSNLTSANLGNSVSEISYSAFSYCSNLSSIVIPETVTIIRPAAFYGSGLVTVYYNAINCSSFNSGGWGYGEGYWLTNCPSLSTVIIGENVIVIPNNFVKNSNITGTLIIPNSVTAIGSSAFKGCFGLSSIVLGNSVTSIGEYAFEDCSGLTGSLTIPNSVASIGNNAFNGCTSFSGTLTLGASLMQIGNSAFFGACESFTSFDVLAETPPNLGENVFISVNYEIPVSVPCGSLNAYQNASGWNMFTNMQEPSPCMWEITATANLAEGGTVSGGGTYEQGTTCTLTAMPSEGYEFVNWKENNTVVSEEATYSFTVEGNRTLVAYFRLPPDPVGTVVAEYYPDPENSESPYVKLHWNGGIESFETSDFSMYNWQLDPTYPWQISTNNPYEGSYCMRSGGSGVSNVTSNMTLTVDYSAEGTISFFSRTSSEGSWDYGHFYIDGQEMGNWSGETSWEEHTYTIVAGSHTFQWRYTKDGSVNQGDDCFYVDNISFNGDGCSHYRVYRADCDNGSFDLLADNVTDVSYTDNSWLQLAVGSYQYGVCAVYNDGTTSSMKVSDCIEKHANITVAITAVPNYEERGTVSGSGDYLQGETCSLTATANEGFEFHNWTEDGQVVSTDAQYSFTVLTARNLVANFSTPAIVFADPNVEAICVANWDTNGDGFLNYDEAAAVTDLGEAFSGNTEITSFNELQYFTGLTAVADYAFSGCSNLSSVIPYLPESITSIGDFAFSNCIAFTGDLMIPEAITSIGNRAFYNCSGFTGDLTIPESVTFVGGGAFIYCGFTTLNYNAIDCEIDWNWGSVPIGNGWGTVCCFSPFACGEQLTTLHIGNQVQRIPSEAFAGKVYNNGDFTFVSNSFSGQLIIPESVRTIEYGAFSGCEGFTGDLVIPDSVMIIGEWAFEGCTGFDGTLTIGSSITTIGGIAFIDTHFTELNYNATNCVSIGAGTNSYNSNDYASVFVGIPYVNIGENVESIPAHAFSECLFDEIIFPDVLVSIGEKAFKNCIGLANNLVLPNSLITIGDQAFYNCYGLEGIVMGNSVETIGSEAFRNCGGLRGELTLPETLQSVGPLAFAGCNEISTVNYNAINCTEMGNASQNVFADCLSLAHIRIGANVESIPNYAFKPCFLVTDMSVAALVPPVISASTFGTVSRNIPVSVPLGSSPAYRTAQYWEEFFHITEDYSSSPYTYHWNVNVHQFADNMTVTGIIQIEGVEQAVPSLEIGAFCNGECRGRQLLTYYPQVDRYLVFLMLYGEEGDMFTFRLYDHEAGEELTVGCASVITFEPDAIVGSFLEPYVFNFTDMQLTQFSEGWNWWSTYVEQEGMDGLSLLEESLGENGVTIRSQVGYTDYYAGYGWYGSLSSINNESSYKIKTSAPCVAAMAGGTAIPSQHPITLNQGWTWMGYVPSFALDINAALDGLEATLGDKVKSQQGYSDYYPGYGWFGSLNTIEPGMGLMYYSSNGEAVTFTYPDGNRGGEELKANLTSENNHWVPNVHAYPDNMTVMAVVEFNDEELNTENYELAAFAANGECRGSVKLTFAEPLNRHVAFLTISGKDAAELDFRLYNAETNEEYYDAEESLEFVANAIVGEADDLYVVHFRGTTGMDEFAGRVRVYPNPVNRAERFSIGMDVNIKSSVRVEIVNSLGTILSVETSDQLPATIKAPTVAGVYTLRIACEEGTCYRKMVVR